MRLEWIAAVLRPEDIASHPSFQNSNYDSRPHVVLATAIDGGYAPLPPNFVGAELSEVHDALEAEAARLAVDTFFAETQRTASTELVDILNENNLDLAAMCAFSLIAANALAELEEFESLERLLNGSLRRVVGADPGSRLLRAILLQQLSMRQMDWGSRDYFLSQEAHQILATLQTANFPSFEVSPRVGGTSDMTIEHIIVALQRAVWSTLPNAMSVTPSTGPNDAEIDWRKIVTAPKSEELLLIERESSHQYSRFIERAFERVYGDRTMRIGGSSPDLFLANLRNELYGTANVYSTRRELALMRLTANGVMSAQYDYAECIRLLRYSKGDKYLTSVLDKLRLGGPLAALSREARQVIARRLTPGYVRSEDLQVIKSSADLLTKSEAQDALAAIFRLLDAGSPQNDPGRWSSHSARLERTLNAAVALAAPAEAANEVSTRLLGYVQDSKFDELVDRAIASALFRLEIDKDSEPFATSWGRWLSRADEWPNTGERARQKLQRRSSAERGAIKTWSDVENVVNDLVMDHSVNESAIDASAAKVSESMTSIRDSAQVGRFAFGGTEPAELAVMLLPFSKLDLWEPLAEFLSDVAVPRQYKDFAFDRMAKSALRIPPEMAKVFLRRRDQILLSRDAHPLDGDPLVPYPAALRMYAAHGLMTDEELVALLTQLSGSSLPRAKVQAAQTLSVLASKRGSPSLLNLALFLSYELDAEIQGYASHAVAAMLGVTADAHDAAVIRLESLMNSDSLIAPLQAIRGLSILAPSEVEPRLRLAVGDLASSHPSRRVRIEAATLGERLG